ncbi:uncharacterized protein LOC107818689 [Nicotiana tabacum]|uniref:Uncharacterized protein LOC107818689 n=2 Tax=Nicotiana TaxID=4085 RepID=A0A1S4CGG4_TOBAC|nr:PREDICTED: uncharacterized protein LOC104238504 [Nicotiana sylvestris]XP_016500211.1 PREDICTED: uncharacterized protein LOC107818689 [Nicotiana tabacum]
MTFNNLAFDSKPVYVNDSLHWLRSDGRVLAFNTKREEATILDLPEFINHHNLIFDIRLGTWLGISKGLLTLFCIFQESIVIAAYDYISSNWRFTHTSDNVITGHVNGYIDGFPIWFDSKQVLFLQGSRRLIRHQYLYEYDSVTNGYKKAQVLNKDYMIKDYLCSFEPTLASVHTTFLDTVRDKHRPAIIATLDEPQRFITEGIR